MFPKVLATCCYNICLATLMFNCKTMKSSQKYVAQQKKTKNPLPIPTLKPLFSIP